MKYQKGHKVLNTGKTWWKKGHQPWNKGKTYIIPKARTGKVIKCLQCGKKKYFQANQLKKRPCLYCSVICARKASRKVELVYSSIHSRIKREWGRAKECEYCGSNKNVDWANISKEYVLKRCDWKQLCRKHHVLYDKGVLNL